jgi:hypothetical protein
MIGSIVVSVFGVAAMTGLSVVLYTALPNKVLAAAERHGRFLGLQQRENLAGGTRAGEPPVGRAGAFQPG